MNVNQTPTIWTIGHSTHAIEEFLDLLRSFDIQLLVDIRRLPGSRKYPQFNQDPLKQSVEEAGIKYLYAADLGGRRSPIKDSKNNRWRNNSFKGYADYMETEAFKSAMETLQQNATQYKTVYMCGEAVWWRCHRSMVSDYLKAKGWAVWHIMEIAKATAHPYTSPAIIVGDQVMYSDAN